MHGFVRSVLLRSGRCLLLLCCRGRRPGCAPGGAVTFSCVAKRKSPKRRRPPVCVPHRPVGRWGQPAMLGPGVTPKNSLRCLCEAAPVKQLRRARQRCACPSARAHPRPCASRHGQKGVGAGSIRAIASLGLWSFAALCSPERSRQLRRQRGARNRHLAQLRKQQPCGTRSPPLLAAPRSAGPGVGACAAGHTHFVLWLAAAV